MELDIPFDLIVTVVDKGNCEAIITASKAAGAEGGTIIPGRGTGIRENKKLWGIPIEPEKDIVLTIVPSDRTQGILRAIVDAGDLNQPGKGIAFVLELKNVAGICHLLNQEATGN
ncbi:P-II family nitrogen regulator [Pseudodesulfovibrio sp. F-1]|uniref:P-II family nitrogen regulator n=1 Tax=Pseudodesulfovibrio alkaliphilus TaxID=2661613 RepID=A0A7K1KM48_9BACT|nr:P-II family nitrogen regulator [Pseudodesulfovibrio alkaliphilus]MUM77163.1 P-II family nitrogen regulator [Pseudodesulfovibrio alkaliphilus]